MQWYISVSAVKDFQRIVGLPQESDGPLFDRAAVELEEVAATAKLKSERGQWQTWQAKMTIRGKVARIELIVSTQKRDEGPLPQLVEVRYKGGSRSGKPRKREQVMPPKSVKPTTAAQKMTPPRPEVKGAMDASEKWRRFRRMAETMAAMVTWPAEETMSRASGDVVCETCGLKYYDHPERNGLVLTCDGRLWHL